MWLSSTPKAASTNGYRGGYHTHRGVLGGSDPNAIAVGTAVHAGGTAAAVNMFSNPVAVFDSVRPLILGYDSRSGGAGPISGLPYLNLDFSVKKKLMIYNRYSLELSGVFQNVMNHMEFANPSLSLQAVSSWELPRPRATAHGRSN